jgi:hypothetical protein
LPADKASRIAQLRAADAKGSPKDRPSETVRSSLLAALELGEALLEDEGSLVLSDGDLLHGDLDAHLIVRAVGLGAGVLLVGVVLAAAGIEDGDDRGLRKPSQEKTLANRP